MKDSLNTTAYAVAAALLLLQTIGCGSGEAPPTASIPAAGSEVADSLVAESDTSNSVFPSTTEAEPAPAYVAPEVEIETTLGTVRVRLHGREVPETVDNFLERYADVGAYNNTVFHHVDAGVLVGGGYLEDLSPVETRAPIRNEAAKAAKNTRGTIAMVRQPDYKDSATSQFYFNLSDDATLDYDEETENDGYCVFGEVVAGLEILDKIAEVKTHQSDDFPNMPVTPILIKSVTRVAP